MRRRRQRHTAPGRVAALEALAVLGLAAGALAQPAAPVQTVVWSGFPPGGLGDQVPRPLLERLQGRWSGNLILDSKVGAGGRIAADFVRRAPAGGRRARRGRSRGRRRSARTRGTPARPGRAHANGARGGGQQPRMFHRPRRPDCRRRGEARLRRGRRHRQRRLPLVVMAAGRARRHGTPLSRTRWARPCRWMRWPSTTVATPASGATT